MNNELMNATNAVDLSGVTFLAPILAFLIVIIIMFALLKKSEILGENDWINVFISLFVGAIFVGINSVRELVLNVIPWFAVLLVAIFVIMALLGLMGKTDDVLGKGLGWFFVIVMLGIFVISGIKVFSESIVPYLPGPFFGVGSGVDEQLLFFFSWLYSPEVFGAVALIISAIAVSFVLIKGK